MSAVLKERVSAARLPNNGAPNKSTTHEERYYHIDNEATVFFREENGTWYASVSLCHWRDNFSRAVGRKVARRKYFTKPEEKVVVDGVPSYEVASELAADTRFNLIGWMYY